MGYKQDFSSHSINMRHLLDFGAELKIEYINLQFRGKLKVEDRSMELIYI